MSTTETSKTQGEEAMDLEISERYINPYTDFGFKKLFGTELNKDLLISFLNALFHDKPEITDLTYMNTEHLGEGIVDRKAAIKREQSDARIDSAEREQARPKVKAVFDVYCRLADGSRIIVEMQKAEQQYFKDRSIYYSTYPIREQAPKGKWDYHLEDVYTVGILNFTFPKDEYPSDSLIHEIKLKDVEDNHVFYDKLTFVYLEMPKFNKTEDELETMFDKWMFALSNLARLLERPKALQERIFTRLFEQAEVARFTPQERNEYVASKKEYWDNYSALTTSYNKGLAKGLAEGEAKGERKGIAKAEAKAWQEKQESARKMKEDHLPIDAIAKYTGLSADEIAAL